MGEFTLIVAGFFVSGLAGAVFGGLLVWVRVGRALEKAEVEPADAFDSVEDETSDEPVLKPELAWWFTEDTAPATLFDSLGLPSARPHRRAVSWPVPAPDELKDGPTRPIRVRREGEAGEGTPWWAGPTREVARDWSGHPTAEVHVGRHRSGEYPVLDGVSG